MERFKEFLEYLLYVLIGILMALFVGFVFTVMFQDTVKINGVRFYCEGNTSYFYTKSEPILSTIDIKENNTSLKIEVRDYKEEKVIIPFNICK
jgi:hypothetical protein